MYFTHAVISFIIAVAGNLSLAWLFLSALIWPSSHREFIQNTGALLFLIEFFGIVSSAFAMGIANEEKPLAERDPRIIMYGSFGGSGGGRPMTLNQMRWLIIAVCMIAVGGVGLSMQNWILPLIFFVSLISKFFASRATENPARFALSIMALIMILVVAVVISIPLGFFVSLGDDGDILVWGVLYYVTLAFIDSAFFFKKEVAFVWKPFYYSLLGFWKIFLAVMRRSPQAKKLPGRTLRAMESAESGGFEAFLKSVALHAKDTIPPGRVVY